MAGKSSDVELDGFNSPKAAGPSMTEYHPCEKYMAGKNTDGKAGAFKYPKTALFSIVHTVSLRGRQLHFPGEEM